MRRKVGAVAPTPHILWVSGGLHHYRLVFLPGYTLGAKFGLDPLRAPDLDKGAHRSRDRPKSTRTSAALCPGVATKARFRRAIFLSIPNERRMQKLLPSKTRSLASAARRRAFFQKHLPDGFAARLKRASELRRALAREVTRRNLLFREVSIIGRNETCRSQGFSNGVGGDSSCTSQIRDPQLASSDFVKLLDRKRNACGHLSDLVGFSLDLSRAKKYDGPVVWV